ncbi:MAG: TerD family protein [Deltaproteobacteria bacterium]|jgi:tellurium resistance protein TerD|nr:TerD family protein [Deltaproteobacteria bacterium]
MAVSLVKGGQVSLVKEAPGLSVILVGMGWDVRETPGSDFDLDASAFLLTDAKKVRDPGDFIFYNNLKSKDGSVLHTGDNRTGEGEGDDESIQIHLQKIAPEITSIAITVTIHDYEARNQNFGQVNNAFIRIVNVDNGKEIARFDLTEDMSTETGMIFGEVFRKGSDWQFKAVGQGYEGGLAALCRNFGIQV